MLISNIGDINSPEDCAAGGMIGGVPDGAEPFALSQYFSHSQKTASRALFIARDAARMEALSTAMAFFAPEISIIKIPAWDCLPFDRAPPGSAIMAARLQNLLRLAAPNLKPGETSHQLIITSVNAVLQRLPTRQWLKSHIQTLRRGSDIDLQQLSHWLGQHGYIRAANVRDIGEFATRGGIIDVFPAGQENPIRLDFFGDKLETLRQFDPETQKSSNSLEQVTLLPVNEIILGDEEITRFRGGYRRSFGADLADDPLYQSVCAGKRYSGMEHWLPLFHEKLETLFEHADPQACFLDHLADDAIAGRLGQIEEHWRARYDALDAQTVSGAVPYRALPADALYLNRAGWDDWQEKKPIWRLSPFEVAPSSAQKIWAMRGRIGRNFKSEQMTDEQNIFDRLLQYCNAQQQDGRHICIACWSEGSRERLQQILNDHDCTAITRVQNYSDMQALDRSQIALAILGLETGFSIGSLTLISEQDILGDRLIRSPKRGKSGADIIREAASLNQGDLVVHNAHGIGRFTGLINITALGAAHDCLELIYEGGDKLFLPVENIELLSRYGGQEASAALDRLGGGAWQARKARAKKKIMAIAENLVATAAARALKKAPIFHRDESGYQEFASRFPYDETPDQLDTIEAVFDDMASGRPMDRLVCGDVGFGKTEIALRAAYITALSGRQVAVTVPTTLLCRQHHATFLERFNGFPIRIGQLSRLSSAKTNNQTRSDLAAGQIDIIVGTHALLAKSVRFKDLGLLIIDEEQHFGVKHKERLKEFKSNVHVLALSATPIPRTLQLAMSGVRELSLIAAPPLDRLAVRNFVSPFDPLTIRETLLREYYRGGQSFYICPRITDLAEIKAFLTEHVPELKVAIAHGQMPPGQLDDVMSAFYDAKYDLLLSTTIVESGLDIPRANTLIIHRADMFGLSQLYQLRGRVGRAKQRAYALFTYAPNKGLSNNAERRLAILQSLEALGSGFQLASQDLDLRGAGNLLGAEQSGNIREVGVELYQQMLEEAVAKLKDGTDLQDDELWSPTINLGVSVMIPENYIDDLQLRLDLYRRLAGFEEYTQIESFGVELIDRFGTMPGEVTTLLKIMHIKILCRRANIEKIEVGERGIVIAFRDSQFANPARLIEFVTDPGNFARLRPDHKIVIAQNWQDAETRMKGITRIVKMLAEFAVKAR